MAETRFSQDVWLPSPYSRDNTDNPPSQAHHFVLPSDCLHVGKRRCTYPLVYSVFLDSIRKDCKTMVCLWTKHSWSESGGHEPHPSRVYGIILPELHRIIELEEAWRIQWASLFLGKHPVSIILSFGNYTSISSWGITSRVVMVWFSNQCIT